MRQNVGRFVELLAAMTEKELRARYKYTIFGFFWLVVNPIIQMLVIGFVFNFFVKNPIDHYYAYLFIGLLAWNFFSVSLTKATPSVVFERALIKKSAFPRSVIPLSIVLSNCIHLLVALTLFVLCSLPFGFIQAVRVPTLALACVLILIFTSGLSLLTSALNVRYRDVNFFVQALLTVWFYATPIVYSFKNIPDHLVWLWRLNPMTAIIQLFQHAFIDINPPDVWMILSNVLSTALTIGVGIWTFQKQSNFFDDWL